MVKQMSKCASHSFERKSIFHNRSPATIAFSAESQYSLNSNKGNPVDNSIFLFYILTKYYFYFYKYYCCCRYYCYYCYLLLLSLLILLVVNKHAEIQYKDFRLKCRQKDSKMYF